MEIQDVFEGIGYKPEGEPTVEGLRAFMAETFVSRKVAQDDSVLRKHFKGQFLAEHFKHLKSKVGEDYVEFEKMDFKEALEAVVDKQNSTLEEVRSKAKEGQSKQVLDLEAKVEDLTKSLGQYKTAAETVAQEKKELEQDFEGKLTSFKIDSSRKDIEAQLPWIDGLTDVQRMGFKSVLDENYKFAFDAEGAFTVRDSEGNMIQGKSAADFLSPAELYTKVAEENGLLKKNAGGERPTRRFGGGGDETKNKSLRTQKRGGLSGAPART